MINRNNYQEYFLLYIDHELSGTAQKAVEEFVFHNPDLAIELEQLRQVVAKPEAKVRFEGKESLMRTDDLTGPIQKSNYEEYFLLYADGELDDASRREVEIFAGNHPSLLLELSYLLQTKMVPDPDLRFPDKSVLYKKEKTRRIAAWPWLGMAAASLLLVIGLFVFKNTGQSPAGSMGHPGVARGNALFPGGKTEDPNQRVTVTSTLPATLDPSVRPGITKGQTAWQTPSRKGPVTARRKVNARDQDAQALASSQLPRRADSRVEAQPENQSAGTLTQTEAATEPAMHPATAAIAQVQEPAAGVMPGQDAINRKADGGGMQEMNTAHTDEVYFAANTSQKKSKLRGIFRRVTRVFEKNTQADDDSRQGLLIGGFQIALK